LPVKIRSKKKGDEKDIREKEERTAYLSGRARIGMYVLPKYTGNKKGLKQNPDYIQENH